MRAMILAAALLVGACATATPYQPAAVDRYGYAEQQIESNRVRITFRGNTLTDRETVETYLLFRAAELTIASGYDHFVIADRGTEARSAVYATGGHRSPFDHWYYSPRFGWRPWYDPFWADPTGFREVTRYEAAAEIAMYRGPKPADDANAFDAREVQANLQGRVVRPPAG